MNENLEVGDLAIRNCKSNGLTLEKYPNVIYRVQEVDEHGNFRGVIVFGMASNLSQRKSQWLGYKDFRKLEYQELTDFRDSLSRLCVETRGVN